MKYTFIALFCFPFMLLAQNSVSNITADHGEVFYAPDVMPFIADCNTHAAADERYKYVCTETKLKKMVMNMLKDQYTDGTVELYLTIDKAGKIVDMEVLNSVNSTERSAAFANLQKQLESEISFTAGQNKGKVVATRYTLRVYMGPGEG